MRTLQLVLSLGLIEVRLGAGDNEEKVKQFVLELSVWRVSKYEIKKANECERLKMPNGDKQM